VTFDFPKGMMYLKQTSVGPLMMKIWKGRGNSYMTEVKGQLPGFSKTIAEHCHT